MKQHLRARSAILALLVALTALLTGCGTPQAPAAAEDTASPVAESPEPAESAAGVDSAPAQTQVPISEPYDGLRVMIVGSGSPTYETGRGQPSTLVQYRDKYFLVDCGNRASDTLIENGIKLQEITNLLMTHQHFDHNADFWSFFMAGSVIANPRPTLTIAGPDVSDLLNATLDYYRDDIDQRIEGLSLTNDGAIYGTTLMDITENTTFELDGVTISTMELPHGLTNYAYKFEADGQTVVVTGDFLDIPALADFARDVDILVADGMLTSSFSFIPSEEARAGLKKTLEISHATDRQLAAIVAGAQAKKTVLTHLVGEYDEEATTQLFTDAGYTGALIGAHDSLIVEP